MRRPLAATALAMVLAGCGTVRGALPALPDTAVARYRCADGTRFLAAFDNRAGTATLHSGEAALGMLVQQRAASGIWYAGDGMILRGKGREASLARAGQPETQCQAEE